jgi:Copper amine oxidase N-terminal domain
MEEFYMVKKHYLATAAAGLLLATTVIPSGASAEVATKNLQAKYNNIKVLRNGMSVATPIEPFIVNGTTYVPLRMMADVFNKDVTWDGKNYTIGITDRPDPGANAALAAKDAEINRLKTQVTSLNSQIESLRNSKSNKDDDDEDLDDLEESLQDDYGDWKDLEWDITLSGDEDDIEVEIELDDDFIDEYEDDIDKSDIEDLVIDIVEDIWEEYDDADITGEITVDGDKEYDFEGDVSEDEILLDDDVIKD